MTTYRSPLLTPPREEEEVYGYRPVWRSLIIEATLLLIMSVALIIAGRGLSQNLPSTPLLIVTLVIGTAPVLLWLAFSWRAENTVREPRAGLLAVAVVTALVARSIGEPLITQFLRVEEWLPLSSAVERIIGYTVTVGVVQSTLIYLTIRFTLPRRMFRIRDDGLAYGIAAAVGYVTVSNLQTLASAGTPQLDSFVLRAFGDYALHIAMGLLIGYGVTITYIGRPIILNMTFYVVLSSILAGITIPIRAGLVNPVFSLDFNRSLVSAPRPLLGLGFSVLILIVPCLILYFLIRNAERRETEAQVEI
ncbi:MAG: PrsW family intramembrane metalloprotease [Anaerolineae bacterium]|nr:PrsW family intramembrane metalloprotease [Anaerolineae bacterium]